MSRLHDFINAAISDCIVFRVHLLVLGLNFRNSFGDLHDLFINGKREDLLNDFVCLHLFHIVTQQLWSIVRVHNEKDHVQLFLSRI